MVRRLLLVVALIACRGSDAPPAPAKEAPRAGSAATPSTAKPAPALPAPAGPDPRALPAEQGFAVEKTDPAWAGPTESTLRTRLAKLPAKIECRTSMCAISITGAPDDLARATDPLQQLNDVAASIMLTRPSEKELRAYLRFER
jgi:hypothetical protein